MLLDVFLSYESGLSDVELLLRIELHFIQQCQCKAMAVPKMQLPDFIHILSMKNDAVSGSKMGCHQKRGGFNLPKNHDWPVTGMTFLSGQILRID
jgi:hypothetical protein